MATSCALCLQPIARSGPESYFVLDGTEVFHRACAAKAGTMRSIGNRRKQELANLKAADAQLTADNEFLKGRIAKLERSHERCIELELEARRLRDRLAEQERVIADLRVQRTALRGERDMANAQVQSLTREIQLLRAAAQQGQTPSTAAVAPAVTPAQPAIERDPSSLRFELLELD